MITPTKGIAPDRALLAVGAQILLQLDEPLTVSQTWARLKSWREAHDHRSPLSFGWFVLALDVLYTLDTVRMEQDLIVRGRAHAATTVG